VIENNRSRDVDLCARFVWKVVAMNRERCCVVRGVTAGSVDVLNMKTVCNIYIATAQVVPLPLHNRRFAVDLSFMVSTMAGMQRQTEQCPLNYQHTLCAQK